MSHIQDPKGEEARRFYGAAADAIHSLAFNVDKGKDWMIRLTSEVWWLLRTWWIQVPVSEILTWKYKDMFSNLLWKQWRISLKMRIWIYRALGLYSTSAIYDVHYYQKVSICQSFKEPATICVFRWEPVFGTRFRRLECSCGGNEKVPRFGGNAGQRMRYSAKYGRPLSKPN